ncbi:MAG: peptidoglycan DD-metalloendopeptidase family protein [Deltaproteobacteria bacterium]|jgi:peptidoglycan LD-endopeptidase LytH|nr:peptidoglycan DD-metalloendopeptidase family protein [Deltaproteobacteria bacterium]MBT6435688.1 peptidoglycan DD-metalloendopeptidase family protein [Deltaproteobacteria bacterium]
MAQRSYQETRTTLISDRKSPNPEDFATLKTEGICFSTVIDLGENYEVYDFTKGYDAQRVLASPYGVGRYDEHRPGMYEGEQFLEDQRDVHVGVDLAGPVGEPVHAFYAGSIFKLGDNALRYDYGPTIITRHGWHEQVVYALHGHLSRESLKKWSVGDTFEAGEVLAWLGCEEENGGWNSHLHFQLSLMEPDTHDLPGAVNRSDRAWALRAFPDPRLVLGPLY